jgi:large conductance mechanosensitive channel
MFKEFRDFIARGNVVDLAVGVIMGASFGKIVTSVVNDMVMPPIGLALGKVNFKDLYVDLTPGAKAMTLDEAKKAGDATICYGAFLNTILEFLIVAFAVFLLVKTVTKFYKPHVKTKECPFCKEAVAAVATRCKFCTSSLEEPKKAELSAGPG